MSKPVQSESRLRAYWHFLLAVLYFFMARSLAHHAAQGLVNQELSPLVEQMMLVFLLLLGYATMGFWFNGQRHPVRQQGLPARAGWTGEAGLGLLFGWGLAVVCVLPLMLFGGIAIVLYTQSSSWGWLFADAAFFALVALAEEVAFRGYGFQRFVNAVGPLGAALGFAAYYAIVQSFQPGANHASLAVSLVLSLLLSAAYLRTRALWVSWGINFGWKASRALLFGLTISGVNVHSPVVQGDPMGNFWMTGGGYGLDGSWMVFYILLAALPVLFHLTRNLNFHYNAPVLIPGGIPVDLDAAARAQHEAAMGAAAPAEPSLIQILPVQTVPAPVTPPSATPGDTPAGSEHAAH